MKKQIRFLRKKMTTSVIIALTCFIAMPVLHAQTVLPNVRLNTTDYYNVSLDGAGKSIAVLNDTVYTVWQGEPTDTTSNIYFSKSIDKGLSFSADLNIFLGQDSIYHVFPSVAVDNSGVIYITWTAVSNNQNYYNIWLAKSTNGGISFQAPTKITTTNTYMYSCVGVYDNNVYLFYANVSTYPCVNYDFVYSANNGQTFSAPMQINDAACAGNINFSDLTTIAIDSAGYIHLAWVDGRRALGHGDIFYAKSRDNGHNFSANLMVNDTLLSGADSVQYMPAIAVYDTNIVYISFTDKRLGNDWTNNRVYMTKSINGGSTFSSESLLAGHNGTCKSHDIATSPSGKLSVSICAHITPNWGVWLFESTDGGINFSTPVALCDTFTMQYDGVNIILNSNDENFAIWHDDRDSIQNIYFAKTDLGTNTGDTTATVCDSMTWYGTTYYASAMPTHTFTNVAGCDSVVTLHLTVNYSNTGVDMQTACDSLVWIDGNTYYATNNVATHTLTNIVGCDSVVTLDLTVNYSNTGTDVQTACDSLVWIDGNTYYANNNTATHTLTNLAGCDSLVTLDLTVNYANTGIDTQTACDSLLWIDGNTYYANNNVATHTLTNVSGCDSVITLNLTVNYSNTGIDTQTACDSLVWIDGNTYYTTNNSATHTLMNTAGCDSVVTLDLTVNYANTGIDVQTACFSYLWIDGNTYTSNNNTATHTLSNAAGCDSVVTLDLTINTVDVSVTVNSITLTAVLSGATYQWVDCANSYAIIAAETNQSFTPTVNGDYAVIIDDGTCMDTSLCYLVTGVGINEDGISSAIVIYPNPTSGLITIEGEDIETIEVFDVNGKVIYKTTAVLSKGAINIDLSGEAKGVYFVHLRTEGGVIVKKVVLD